MNERSFSVAHQTAHNDHTLLLFRVALETTLSAMEGRPRESSELPCNLCCILQRLAGASVPLDYFLPTNN